MGKLLLMAMWALYLSLASATAETKTTALMAETCFLDALEKIRRGGDFKTLVLQHIDSDAVVAQALRDQRLGTWASLTQPLRQKYRKAVLTFISTSKRFTTVMLDTVAVNAKRGKAVGRSFELPGSFINTSNQRHSFAFRIVATGQKCTFTNGRLNEVWLSTVVELK